MTGPTVLHLMAGAEVGGAEAFFTRLVPALARAGVAQQAVLRPHPGREGALAEAGVPVVRAPYRGGAGRLFDRRTPRAIRRALAAFRPDVVLSWMNRASAACPTGPHVQVGRLGGYYDLKHYRRCRHLIGNTPDIVTWLQAQGWPKDRAHYVPNFVAAPGPAVEPRAAHETPADAPVLLALGRLHANKAFDVLIQALARVPTAILWLAGSGPEDGVLKSLARRVGVADRVRWLGWREDVSALYRAADVFVCPSRHEPLGNVVIEAWAHAKPAVAAAAQGPRQLIEEGRTGWLVPVDDAAALGDRLNAVLADPVGAQAVAAAGQAAYAADYTDAAVVARYIDLFRQVTA